MSISPPLQRRVIEAMTELIIRLFTLALVLLLAAAAVFATLGEMAQRVAGTRPAHS